MTKRDEGDVVFVEVNLATIEKGIVDTNAEAILESYNKAHAVLTDREIVEASLAIVGTAAGAMGDEPDLQEGDATAMMLTLYIMRGVLELADEQGQIIGDVIGSETNDAAQQ